MIGAILGDMIGSRFEFHNRLSKEFELLTEDSCWTDDTVMSCAVAEALLEAESLAELPQRATAVLKRFGQAHPDAGYGARFIRWVFEKDPQPYNSYGNGSAMRISAVGFAAKNMDELRELSRAVTAVSHDHPEGLKGAEATAAAIFLLRQGMDRAELREYITKSYGYDLSGSVEGYRQSWNGHGAEICQVSVPQALVCFFEGESYEDTMRNCVSIGGDSDTICAIAGGMAEALWGVPRALAEQGYALLSQDLLASVRAFEEKYPANIIA